MFDSIGAVGHVYRQGAQKIRRPGGRRAAPAAQQKAAHRPASMRTPKWIRNREWEARWHALAEDIREGMGDDGPISVVHHSGQEHKLLQQGKQYTLFQRFNACKGNKDWQLVHAWVGSSRLALDGRPCQSHTGLGDALSADLDFNEAFIEASIRERGAREELLYKVLPYRLCVQQDFQCRDKMEEGFCALFRPKGLYTYCDDCRPERWCQLGPNTVLVHHMADPVDDDDETKDYGEEVRQKMNKMKNGDDLWQYPDEGEDASYRLLARNVQAKMGGGAPLFVFHHSGYEARLLGFDQDDPHCEYTETRFQQFNRHAEWPLVQASVGPCHTIDLVGDSGERPSKLAHALARDILERDDMEPAYIVQRLDSADAESLYEGTQALFGDRFPHEGDHYCSSFGCDRWCQLSDNAILVVHDAESG